jgi:hypothetical protein
MDRTQDGDAITVAELEGTLNCKILHGFGMRGRFPASFIGQPDDVREAFSEVFEFILESRGLSEPSELPELVMFSDSIDSNMFDLRYSRVYAKFKITPTAVQQIYLLRATLSDATHVLVSINYLRNNLEHYKSVGHDVTQIASDFDDWVSSLDQRSRDVSLVIKSAADCLVGLFKSGWE